MLSYRHAYHAGNHADVLKHFCLSLIIRKLVQKDKPLTYIDTHAAAGLYNLKSHMAAKNREFADGIDRLAGSIQAPEMLRHYLSLVQTYRTRNQYPGSPKIAAELLRPCDRLVLLELHENEFVNLKNNMQGDARVALHHRDAIEGALALCPPEPKRGLMLIDPPYELNEEYIQVADLIKKIHKKWPVGVLALWYPLLAKARNRAPKLIHSIAANKPTNLFVAELWVGAQQEEAGMYGSGMAFINLPWQLDEQIKTCMPLLVKQLAEKEGGFRAEWIIQEEIKRSQ